MEEREDRGSRGENMKRQIIREAHREQQTKPEGER